MKKLIIAAVILLITASQTFAGPIVTISFQIGKMSKGCDGFGICGKITVSPGGMGSMQLDQEGNTLLINLNKELTAGKEQYFKGQTVTFEEAVIIPNNVQNALGSKIEITIAAGTYKLIRTKNGYQINVPLN